MAAGRLHIGDGAGNRHATAHFDAQRHPLIQSYEPGEDWWYCYVDDLAFAVDDEGETTGTELCTSGSGCGSFDLVVLASRGWPALRALVKLVGEYGPGQRRQGDGTWDDSRGRHCNGQKHRPGGKEHEDDHGVDGFAASNLVEATHERWVIDGQGTLDLVDHCTDLLVIHPPPP